MNENLLKQNWFNWLSIVTSVLAGSIMATTKLSPASAQNKFDFATTTTTNTTSNALIRALVPTPTPTILWINPLDLLAGDPSVKVSFNAVSSGLGLSGLIIESSTIGDTALGGGNKVVEKGLTIPPGFILKGVRVCYQSSNSRSFITQIRLSQVQDPPSSAFVRLDDGTDLTNLGPICVNSSSTSVDPTQGAVFLSLRTNFGSTNDRIVIRSLGLLVSK